MKGFEPVTISWKGEAFTVPAEDQLPLIAKIEDALSDQSGRPAVLVLTTRGGPSYSRLAAAYGAAMRHAGASVTDAEIYLSITEDLAKGDAEIAEKLQNAVLGLLAIIAPPVYRQLTSRGEPGKPEGDEDRTPEA
ncbi:hypothetical protein [Roseovarius sp. C03]|uniref:hypothetical protein n=1 Tax=Roseovarius sp. C03 TaxID=3449222 RepID=UPI003EDBE529